MIKIENLNKYYKSGSEKYHALRDINLTLPDKGMVYIVGKSGSGKSTLLNIIGGIDSFDSGELYIDNVKTSSFTKKDYNAYRNTYIGFVFQEFNVIKSLSIYDNIALSLELHNLDSKENKERILKSIADVGLAGKENRMMNEISGGERQRVAIARALVKEPQVIIADEPTGNLDSKNRDIVMNILKDLSKKRLVLIVTHDKNLSKIYGDMEVTIKDGKIINQTTINEVNVLNDKENLLLNPIDPSLKTSFHLGIKSFKRNIFRFLFITILFSFSLVFAGVVMNLWLADTSYEYANYQQENGNFVVDLSRDYDARGYYYKTGFFQSELDDYKNEFIYGKDNGFKAYTSMPIDININKLGIEDDFYQDSISHINIYSSTSDFEYVDDFYGTGKYNCIITDYLANALLKFGYIKGNNISSCLGKYITIDGFNSGFYIQHILKTNSSNFTDLDFSNTLVSTAFIDNLIYYNSIFVNQSTYESFFVGGNSTYTTDNIVYESLGKKGTLENVKFKPYKSENVLVGRVPTKPKQGEQNQLAISSSLLKDVFGIDYSSVSFLPGTQCGMSLDGVLLENFYICGTSRIPSSMSFIVTAVIESDEYIYYFPKLSDYTLYSSFISSSYVEGGYLMMTISDNIDNNSAVYKQMLNKGISINNKSFIKLLIVDTFIKDNLFLFLALFFVFCLFSVLMIFNFIIITIKNSTRDIGIYMSLGMNGFKISMIYFFQVLIISSIASVIGLIGTGSVLLILDSIFSAQALVNFQIIHFTFIGIITILSLGFLTPTVAIIFPLLNLSVKKPIDVIKLS